MAETQTLRTRSQLMTLDVRPNRYARRRAVCLSMVYVLMGLHVAHWKISGKTLAPLELNEVMYTLEVGIVTAGLIFMAVAVVATAMFGRFWGCHILALQDLCAWILRRCCIRARPVRSRLLLWVPLVVAAYMFVWPQVNRVARGQPMARLHVATDNEGWGSFTTEQFWRNLPSMGVTLATFFVCGFAIVYVLGSRSFCAYACPYGAVFGLADRFAPGRIRVGRDCTQCGACTSVCPSQVRVHEELDRYGMVVNPACLKDLDCVSACPQESLHYGFGRPSLFRRLVGRKEVKKLYDFSFGEEFLAGMVFLAAVLIYRGLYDVVPFLLSLGIAAILAYGAVLAFRLARHRELSFGRCRLRRAGRLSRWGAGFAFCAVLAAAFSVHSAVVRYSVFQGERLSRSAMATSGGDGKVADQAIAHLVRAQAFGIVYRPRIVRLLGGLYASEERWRQAEACWRALLAYSPSAPEAHERLAFALAKRGKTEEARGHYVRALSATRQPARVHYGLAGVEFSLGHLRRAADHLRASVRIRPEYAEAHFDLGAVLVEMGTLDEGIAHLRESIRLDPGAGDARYNLGVALAMAGRLEAAMDEVEEALALQPQDEQTRAFHAYLVSISEQRRLPSQP